MPNKPAQDFFGIPEEPNFTGTTVNKHDKAMSYYVNGQLHREEGPASEYWFQENVPLRDREGHWYKHGKLHRLDGPAVNFHSPGDEDDFYIEGQLLEPCAFWNHPLVVEEKLKRIFETEEE